MANVIKLKRGSGSDPSASDLVVGEVAIRTDSGKLFTKKDNGTIAEISGSGGGSDIFINTLSSSSGSGGGSATFNGTATRFTLSNPPAVSAQQLLVSINGVVQKPNSGTSPSEGFAIDGNDIIFAAAPATGSDFFIVTYGSLNIAVPADNSVTSAKIVDGTIVGTDLATNIDLVDNQKIRFGTGNDLQIYHDGTHSYIENLTGGLYIKVGNGEFLNRAGNEVLAKFIENGAVELYHDNVVRLTTSTTGLTIGGGIVTTHHCTFGGNLLPDTANTRDIGSSSKPFNDAFLNGITMLDNKKILLGNSSDLQIYHDGTHSRIVNTTNYLTIKSDLFGVQNQAGDHDYITVATANTGPRLHYDNAVKFETTSGGATLTGNFLPDANNTRNIGSDTLGWNSIWASTRFRGNDNVKLILGDAQDLQIYHDGSHSYIKNSTNYTYYLSTQHHFKNAADNELQAKFGENAGVELYYDNSEKFKTDSTGTIVTGQQIFTNTGVASAYIGANSDGGVFGSDTAGLVFKTGVTGGGSVASTGTVRMQIHNNQFTSFGTGGDTIIYNHSLSDSYVGGVVLDGLGAIQAARHNDQCLLLNRMGTDGTIQTFYNDGTCVGFISVSGSTTAYSTNCSDRTLKKNFEDWTENTLSYFKNIKPQKFNFITEEDTVDKTKGYVAQDLVDNFPEAYPKNDEGKYVFNPSGMVVYLMKALQEAVVRIEALEAG